jgi:hypothetical protein
LKKEKGLGIFEKKGRRRWREREFKEGWLLVGKVSGKGGGEEGNEDY